MYVNCKDAYFIQKDEEWCEKKVEKQFSEFFHIYEVTRLNI